MPWFIDHPWGKSSILLSEVKERDSEGFEKQAREKPMWEEEEHLRQLLSGQFKKDSRSNLPFPQTSLNRMSSLTWSQNYSIQSQCQLVCAHRSIQHLLK